MELRTNVTQMGNIYGKWQIGEETWCITDHWQNFIYLLIGREKAMLIDTGSGEGNVRQVVEGITDKPIMVVNTHGHFDHTGGNSCWPEAWMTEQAAVHAKTPFDTIHGEWFCSKPYKDYEIHLLRDGDKIDLGERCVEVISVPAHSEGSIAFLDENTRWLFCGDEIESGQVIWFVRNESISLEDIAAVHRVNMEKLLERRKDYDLLWPSHNGAPINPTPYLKDFIALDEAIIEGKQKILSDTAGFGFPADNQAAANLFMDYGSLLRAEKGLAAVVYASGESVYHNKQD